MSIPEFIAHYFVKIQFAIFVIGALFCIRILQSGKTQTNFKSREADRTDLDKLRNGPGLADAKMRPQKPTTPPPVPLNLPGIRLTGEAHEILGVDENASEAEIMRAYKESIKRFHPDRIQGQAKDQIQFYEQAAAKLNQAKEDMVKSLKYRKD
jgi:DnaJ-domain-containing protein 1